MDANSTETQIIGFRARGLHKFGGAPRSLVGLYDAATDSGFRAKGEFTGGCADTGFTAAVGAPTICAVGPVGGNAHSPDEFLRIDSLIPRAQACARAILRLERTGL
jgi:glutamate carboxypeptidase